MPKTTPLAALAAACAVLAGCGGSDDSPPPAPPAPQSFSYIPPTLGETDTWTRVLTDSAGTSVTMQIRQQVSAVDDAGVRTVVYDDPTAVDVVADGLTFRTTPEVEHVTASGNATDYTNTGTDGTQVTCVYGTASPAAVAAQAQLAQALGLRHADSIYVGESWTSSYTIACGTQAAVTFDVSAAVLPVESVTVAAGTFQALKETVVTRYTSGGFANVNSVTLWRDPSRSLFPVKIDEAYTRGDQSKVYMAHETRELLSRQ